MRRRFMAVVADFTSAAKQGLAALAPTRKPGANAATTTAGIVADMAARKIEAAGRGLSMQFAFGSHLAQVAEVSVGAEGDVKVHRVVCALDCGQGVNPDTVTAPIESGVVFGLTAALWNEINFDQGRVQQSNFGDYRMMRINEAPRIEVRIVRNADEPGTTPVAPALTNAVFAATGQRARRLPVAAAGLKAV